VSKKQALKAISLLWLGSLLGAGCAFLTQVILARQLGPAEFGAFATAFAMVTMLMPLAGFGVAQYLLKAFGKEGWVAIRFFPASFRFVLMSTSTVTIVLIGWSIFGVHDESLRTTIAILSTYIMGQVAVELVSSKLQLEERYVHLALLQFSPHFIRLLLVVLLTFWTTEWLSVENVAYAYSTVAIGLALLGVSSLFKVLNGKLNLKGHVKPPGDSTELVPDVKAVITQSWPFGLAGLFHFIYFQSDIVLIQFIMGVETAGIYNVAFTIMVAVLLFPSIIYQKFLLPKMHRWANHDRERFYQVYRQGNVIMLVLGLVAMILIWIIMPWVVPLLFGNAYQGSIDLLLVLALSAPILFVASSVGATLVTQSHIKNKVKLMGGVAILNIILNLVLIPRFGAIGAAFATVFSNFVLLVIFYISAQKLVFGQERIKV
jgi:O-antigen/teichoic acid export membrane protein